MDTMISATGIGWAIGQLRGGARVRRRGWNGKHMWLVMVFGSQWDMPPARNQQLAAPGAVIADGYRYRSDFVAIRGADGGLVPWLCSQTDLLASDWEMVVE